MYRLKDRDAHIGWTASLRALRQKPVVRNRRFTLLAKRGERPNLASQVQGLAARELLALLRAGFGYEGDRCELAVGRGLVRATDLSNALVSADALHCQQETVREVALSGGKALVQVKGNQKGNLDACENVVAGRAPL